MDINKLIRNLEGDFEQLRDMDFDDVEDQTVREFLRDLQEFGEDHGFDGERKEYGVKFYAEFTVYEEAQSPVEAQRRAHEKMPDYLTREIADDGFMRHAENIECIDVEEM